MNRKEARDALRALGRRTDAEINPAEVALLLAALESGEDPAPYQRHLDEIVETMARVDEATPEAERTLTHRIDALRTVMVEYFGYDGDDASYEDPRNANLMRVIDRRMGLPVALGILFLHAARSRDWDIDGLSFPGHFLVRLEKDGERAILDPFASGRRVSVSEMRQMLKQSAGLAAELAPQHYAAAGNRDIILRLQNNIKLRALQGERWEEAADLVDTMLLLAPDNALLWREMGLLRGRLGHISQAVTAFGTFLSLAPAAGVSDEMLRQARDLLTRLRRESGES